MGRPWHALVSRSDMLARKRFNMRRTQCRAGLLGMIQVPNCARRVRAPLAAAVTVMHAAMTARAASGDNDRIQGLESDYGVHLPA